MSSFQLPGYQKNTISKKLSLCMHVKIYIRGPTWGRGQWLPPPSPPRFKEKDKKEIVENEL